MIKKEIAKAGKYLKESVDNDKRYAIQFDVHNVDGCVICDHHSGVNYARTLKQAEYIFDKLVKISKSYDRNLVSIGFPSFLGDSLIDIYDTFKIYSNGKLIKDQKPDRIVEEDWYNNPKPDEDGWVKRWSFVDNWYKGPFVISKNYAPYKGYHLEKVKPNGATAKHYGNFRTLDDAKAEASKYLNESIKNSRYIKSVRRYSRSDVRR